MKKILSLLAVFAITFTGVLPAFAQYGGGGGRSSSIGTTPLLVRDACPDGDFSGSLYDDECDATEERLTDGGSIVDGYIFYDDNNNGSFDSNEDAIQGAIVTLLERTSRDALGTDITNSRGYYEFVNVQPGQYTIRVELPVSFFQAIITAVFGSVNAQSGYEFDVTVTEDGQIVQQDVAVERDGDTTVVVDSDADADVDGIVTSPSDTNDILDGFDSLDVVVPAETDVMVPVMAPSVLPQTGANPFAA